MKKILIFVLIVTVIPFLIWSLTKIDTRQALISPTPPKKIMEFRSIDTMKYSRDLSREKLNDPSFDKVIDNQISNISKTGATHVAIATPYDDEFLPILRRWVKSARKYNLKVWFRGNWSGWEQWFEYGQIDRKTHIEKTRNFILVNKDLFENGDVFSACPECENGGPGDPRKTKDIEGHRKFLIDEYKVTKKTFSDIGKKVASNFDSMNRDVAALVMDEETTKSLDGLVVIDHYVSTPDQLIIDIRQIARQTKGRVILGEFGVPIPDLNGNMTEEEQADWLDKAYSKLIKMNELAGTNYWVNIGGSTQLWDSGGKPRKSVNVINAYYHKILR